MICNNVIRGEGQSNQCCIMKGGLTKRVHGRPCCAALDKYSVNGR